MTIPQTPLPGEPGVIDGESEPRAPHPGPDGARRDDPGSGPGRCCSCRDLEDDADPGCILHGDPAVNGTADYSRPGDPECGVPGCTSKVRRYAGYWWHVGPWGNHPDPAFWLHRPRPAQDPIAELPYETTLDEDERHDR